MLGRLAQYIGVGPFGVYLGGGHRYHGGGYYHRHYHHHVYYHSHRHSSYRYGYRIMAAVMAIMAVVRSAL
jgi:hypothetical protein